MQFSRVRVLPPIKWGPELQSADAQELQHHAGLSQTSVCMQHRDLQLAYDAFINAVAQSPLGAGMKRVSCLQHQRCHLWLTPGGLKAKQQLCALLRSGAPSPLGNLICHTHIWDGCGIGCYAPWMLCLLLLRRFGECLVDTRSLLLQHVSLM